LIRRDYYANGGWETFLEYGDPEQDILIGLLRLRKCSKQSFRKELKGKASIVRELHVYGSAVPVGGRHPKKFQHHVRFLNRDKSGNLITNSILGIWNIVNGGSRTYSKRGA